MKKLMIAAAIVCAAAMSQAASFSWSMTQVANGYDTGKATVNGTAYLFITQGETAEKLVALSTIQGWLTAGDLDSVKNSANYIDTATVSGGAVSAKTSPTVTGLKNDTAFTVYAVVVNSDESYMYLTNAKSDTTDALGGETSATFGKQGTASTQKGSWYAVAAVPEPTSGLLLLLGVAGLALKRKRA